VTFESGSRLERIEEYAFCGSGLQSILIPSSVVVLCKESFSYCGSLASVSFESGSRLERIEESAFHQSGLNRIEIPSSVVVLGKSSFSYCESLESVTFESGSRLERIEEYAFSWSVLKSIEIPLSVAFLCGSAFCTPDLTSISVSLGHQHFRIRESFLEDICGSTIYRSYGSYGSIVIPSSVVVLARHSFYNCKSLGSVRFESGSRLERIEEIAFYESGLTSIEIPSSVVVLGTASFWLCHSLESVRFESGSRLERIEESAFAGNQFGSNQLKTISIPSSVVVLGKGSFSQCKSLDSVIFESSRLERIEASAFYKSGLKSIEIPSSVVVLGRESFSGCKSLESVTFESGSRLERIEESAFEESYS
jgi:hypothetical protein